MTVLFGTAFGTVPFGAAPFEAQLAQIDALAASGADPRPLLREAGSAPDAEPLARLLEALAERGRLAELDADLGPILAELPEAALQHLLTRDSAPAVAAQLERLVEDALHRWPIARLTALAFAARWLRRRSPDAYARLVASAEGALASPPADPRWLLFTSGLQLAALADDPRWAELVHRTASDAIDVLARTPKSISQANAERLLAQRVYADPGHFFFELLQNADDAGATRWSVHIDSDRVVVRHDGAPFSFLDLIGVLSIGQTTKRADQIGFFGVGFKSVYEVCERPRIRSGAFAFEIAHVSIPRALGPSPEEAPAHAGETVLVLPYARPLDVRVLHERALAVPPETLMTLPHLAALAVRGPDGARTSWRKEASDAAGGAQIRLEDEARGVTHAYRCAEHLVLYDGAREEGRARESAVLAAVAVSAEGAPEPVEGPTLYAFLPTAERTGLRVMVHARFDVTLDRERLELGSPWNEALLTAAGEALATVVRALSDEGHDVLPALAAPSERAPSMAPLVAALAAQLRTARVLPAARGGRVAPVEARLLAPALADALARALADVDLGDGTYALAPLGPRERSVAEELGARPFGALELVVLLESRLEHGAPPPAWLEGAVLEAIATAPVDDARLAALPLLVDGAGQLTSAERARLAPASWAALYAGERSLVPRETLADLPRELVVRLALRAFEPAELASDLRDPERRARLLAREAQLFSVLAELDEAALRSIDDLPLFPTEGGDWASARMVAALEPSLAPLRAALAVHVPLIARRFAEEHRDALARWVGRWIERFGLADLALLLEADPDALGEPTLARLERVLDGVAPRLSRELLLRFGALPIALDRHGARRPLVGPGRALRADPLPPLPEWPWLARPDAPLVEAVSPPPVDARAIAAALAGDPALPSVPDGRLAETLTWLAPRAGDLPGSLVDRLAVAPVWLDTEGAPRRLDGLRRGTPSEALDALYEAIGTRQVASEGALRFARALGLDRRLPGSDHATLVGDLVRTSLALDAPDALLAPALEEAALRLRADELTPVAALPLFTDHAGTRRALGTWRAPDESRAHRPGAYRGVLDQGPWPLLSAEDEARMPALLAAIGPPVATPADVVAHAGALLADPETLFSFVREHAESLDEPARAAIAELPLFPSGAGARAASRELTLRGPLLEALGPQRLASLGLEGELVAPGVEPLLLRLALPTRSSAALLEARVLPALREGQPLGAQPAPWRSADDLLALARCLEQAGLALDGAIALDAAGRVVRGPCWTASDAARDLVAALPLAERLADARWAEAARASLRDTTALLAPLPPRRVAEALREACPGEAPRAGHPVVRDESALFAWLREVAKLLTTEREDGLRGVLGGAALIPSQRGTLRAPRDLVLDADLPDLGLGWGLASDVPVDVAQLLHGAFELDRRARRALVGHVLDGIDEAARTDDVERGADLLAFLARALGAADSSGMDLEERVRRLEVRARLRVPVEHAHGRAWDKPRFAWAPSDRVAAQAERFALDLPPRIALPEDGPTQRLLAACGARDDLDDAAVIACLDGAVRGATQGTDAPDSADARRALARYVAARALASPARAERWRLSARAWVPARDGTWRRPSELVWPDPLAHALFGEGSAALPDRAVLDDLPEEAAARLGFRRAATLELPEVARLVGRAPGSREEARPALLAWLEDALAARRFASSDVRAALREVLVLRDDEGTARPVPELARSGARELFGSRRGDFGASREYPQLARALGIPATPDAPMILAFLLEVGADTPEPAESDRLAQHLPECLERLAAASDPKLVLGAAVAGMHGERVVITRIGDPALRMLAPTALADGLDAAALDAWIDPLPTERDEALETLLHAAGVPDLWSMFEARATVPGPRREDLDRDAEALRASLALMLPSIGARARVVEALAVRGVLGLASGGYRSAGRDEVTVPVEAALDGDTLLLTPAALREPARIAPALERDPARRVALAKWLAEGRPEVRPPKAAGAASTPKPATPEAGGLFRRMKRWLGGSDSPPPAEEAPTRPSPSGRRGDASGASRDERFFRPRADIEAQLEGTDGWLDARREAPQYGFAFTPASLEPPWLYAHSLVATRFVARGQRWDPIRLPQPPSRGDAGALLMRGRLHAGENLLPVPLYGRVVDVRVDGEVPAAGRELGVLRLDRPADVRLRMVLGAPPDLESARPAAIADALASVVPDADLPDEVHDALASLDEQASPFERALALRDFVRARYRYDPSYLEDPAVGRWLARVTQGRPNAHVAALHAGADGRYLGAGVCYELNVLACELLRRAGIPCAIATGWVLNGGQLSEPDHLWALALLEDARGEPVWVPIDASTTRDGRPLRVPRRPPGRFRPPPAEPRARAPKAPRWERLRVERDLPSGGPSGGPSGRASKKKRPPRAELIKVLRHLEKLAGEPLDPERRAELEEALTDRAAAETLLRRLRA